MSLPIQDPSVSDIDVCGVLPIVIYIHICQKGNWQKSFNMTMDTIRNAKLYEASSDIRIGVINDSGVFNIDENPLLNDPKFNIVYVGKSEEYERPTLLHMKRAAETDAPETKYFYFHTKGIRWFGTEREPFIIDWIKLMNYWNIEKWQDAFYILNKYDTYGCIFYNGIATGHSPHYSGNFFWTTTHHLKTLQAEIGPGYMDPECWLFYNGNLNGSPNAYNAFISNTENGYFHYKNPFPESLYRK